ncbi:AraC family transcriptional regulator [Marinicauda algicola]|uniref:AraC family transcriptional regulator n=1 Tax=Marinicauda algicola TaxID=2029849 RepID=A0A4S2H2A9_9PROT|nr:helix-turn-helix domain-containing protein [Marinicauda algicola]TGY89656.1 AraC family transcriptional regulator [Marinicauda algicola]
MDAAGTVDLMLRGAAAGVSLILAATLVPLARRSLSALFGTLFALGAMAYSIASSALVADQLPALAAALKPLAMMTGVFFWWFALALFCDARRWRASRLIPLAIVSAACAAILVFPSPALDRATIVLHELVNAALMIHVIVIIAGGHQDDLVQPRRKFRTIWVGAIALTVLSVAVAELWKLFADLPSSMHLVESMAILVVACGIAAWSIGAKSEFFPEERSASTGTGTLAPTTGIGTVLEAQDRHLALRLRTAMDQGAWRTPGLTVAGLAERLGTQEHRLRAVINQGLGYRNFAAFLNEYRIGAAKTALADPAASRRQILQIALDLGYGSIAPFNRAFREMTGMTPSEYRRAALKAVDIPAEAAAE